MQLGTFIEKIGFRHKDIAYIAELSALTLLALDFLKSMCCLQSKVSETCSGCR